MKLEPHHSAESSRGAPMVAWLKVLHRVELSRPTLPAVKGRIGGLDQFIMALIATELSLAGGDCAIRDRGTLL